MQGDQLSRQWRIIRAIEASPNGLTVTEIAQREKTGIRTIYRDLEALQAGSFPLYTERADNRKAGRWCKVNLLVMPKRGGKSEQVFEHDFWSLEETNLWQRKMGKEAG